MAKFLEKCDLSTVKTFNARDLPVGVPRMVNRKVFQQGRREGNIHRYYEWQETDDSFLGSGTYGKVFRARSSLNSRTTVAVKKILRSAVDNVDELWQEVSILTQLEHPNVLRFLEAYEDVKNIYIVTEECLGGSLQQWLPRVSGNVAFASRISLEVTGALSHCHARGVCHRDLKPQNILMVRDSIDSSIRIADFGLAKQVARTAFKGIRDAQAAAGKEPQVKLSGSSVLCRKLKEAGSKIMEARAHPPTKGFPSGRRGRRPSLVYLKSFKGTPVYMAPEVLKVLDVQTKRAASSPEAASELPDVYYDFRCDVWSLGVVLHMLLTGEPPYEMEQIAAFVAEGVPLPSLEVMDPNHTLANESFALDFVGECLVTDFTARADAEALLNHMFLEGDVPDGESSPIASSRRTDPKPMKRRLSLLDRATATEIADRLQRYTLTSNFKKAALLAATKCLTPYEHEQLRCMFQKIDTNNSGKITLQELRNAFDFGSNGHGIDAEIFQKEWVDRLARMLDTDVSGSIDYTEFLAAAMDVNIHKRRDLALAAFRAFDVDNDNGISRTELLHVLASDDVTSVQKRAGKFPNDEINFDEFVELLKIL